MRVAPTARRVVTRPALQRNENQVRDRVSRGNSITGSVKKDWRLSRTGHKSRSILRGEPNLRANSKIGFDQSANLTYKLSRLSSFPCNEVLNQFIQDTIKHHIVAIMCMHCTLIADCVLREPESQLPACNLLGARKKAGETREKNICLGTDSSAWNLPLLSHLCTLRHSSHQNGL
jgi:hypothetical protein